MSEVPASTVLAGLVSSEASTIRKVNGLNSSTGSIIPKLSKIVSPYNYGAKGDGSTDDTQAFQSMLGDSSANVFLITGTFCITSELDINRSCTFIFRNGAIKANAYMHNMIKMSASIGIDGDGISYLDLNNQADCGVLISNNSILTIRSMRIYNLKNGAYGVSVDYYNNDTQGYLHLFDVTIANSSDATETRGVNVGRDSIINHLETQNIVYGIRCFAWNVFINGYHPWNDLKNVTNNGVGVYIESNSYDTFINDYYCDSMKYGVYMENDSSVFINNILVMWNTQYFNSNNGSTTPYLLFWKNTSLSNPGSKVKISNADLSQNAGDIVPAFGNLTSQASLITSTYTSWTNVPN